MSQKGTYLEQASSAYRKAKSGSSDIVRLGHQQNRLLVVFLQCVSLQLLVHMYALGASQRTVNDLCACAWSPGAAVHLRTFMLNLCSVIKRYWLATQPLQHNTQHAMDISISCVAGRWLMLHSTQVMATSQRCIMHACEPCPAFAAAHAASTTPAF